MAEASQEIKVKITPELSPELFELLQQMAEKVGDLEHRVVTLEARPSPMDVLGDG